MGARYSFDALHAATGDMFRSAGMESEKADRVAESLLAADMIGHAGHGLALAPWYFDSIAAGGVTLRGDHEVVAERGLMAILSCSAPTAATVAPFGGTQAFVRQTTWLADACRANPPRPGVQTVRVPGENAMKLHRAAIRDGVPLSEPVVEALRPYAARFAVELPAALS